MFTVRAITLLAIPFVAHAASVASRGACNRRYTIQENDICDSISAANKVSTYQLATINAGYIHADCGNLQPGASICLGYAGEDCSTTYVVAGNDSCEAITASFGIGSDTLYTNNPQINAACDNLYIGEVLCVSSSVQVPPAPGGPTGTATTGSTEEDTESTQENTESTESSEEDEDDDDLPYCDEL
ncbi:hypothetical protein C8R46DRAFT_988539 [Mycena filopes]|nr:hypothetical protein C8R46DRAFT_988539 [Mycena filopes]